MKYGLRLPRPCPDQSPYAQRIQVPLIIESLLQLQELNDTSWKLVLPTLGDCILLGDECP